MYVCVISRFHRKQQKKNSKPFCYSKEEQKATVDWNQSHARLLKVLKVNVSLVLFLILLFFLKSYSYIVFAK